MDLTGERIAAAPASWGICELPDWGHQLSASDVLAEMREVGLLATELGPDGFVPGETTGQHELLDRFGLRAIGAFCPLVLHDASHSPRATVRMILDRFAALGADRMVIAAATGTESYDDRPQLDDVEWDMLVSNLADAVEMAAERGIKACVHPHIGTMIEHPVEVARILEHSDVPLCLDTGHLLVGGSDPVQLARDAPERIGHVHLKDVDWELLASVRANQRTYTEAVRLGMYKPLGAGDGNLEEVIRCLEASGYRGWYVPEQDRMLPAAPARDAVLSEVRASIGFIRSLLRANS